MTTIPQKELRNNVGEVLRRAEAGERIIVTVAGRAVAELGPLRGRRWVQSADLRELWELPANPTLAEALEGFEGDLGDPWAR